MSSIFVAPNLKSGNIPNAAAKKSHVPTFVSIKYPLNKHILLVIIGSSLSDLTRDINPQTVLVEAIFVVILM